MNDKLILKYHWVETQEEVREHIQDCEGRHTQQAIYSTFHDALTQVCFGCLKVRSTIKIIGFWKDCQSKEGIDMNVTTIEMDTEEANKL